MVEKHVVKFVNPEKRFGFTTGGVHFSERPTEEITLGRVRKGDNIYGIVLEGRKGRTLGCNWHTEERQVAQEAYWAALAAKEEEKTARERTKQKLDEQFKGFCKSSGIDLKGCVPYATFPEYREHPETYLFVRGASVAVPDCFNRAAVMAAVEEALVAADAYELEKEKERSKPSTGLGMAGMAFRDESRWNF